MSSGFRVAVVGATGVVGNEMLAVLEQRDFPIGDLQLLASERSIGKTLKFKGEEIPVKAVDQENFKNTEIVLLSAGGAVSKKVVPRAVADGAVCIDNTSAFRMDPDVPLVVPEVNPDRIFDHKGIIANPNCSTIQMVVVLAPIHRAVGIRRVVVATYQSTSGAGKAAMDELFNQTKAVFSNQEIVCRVFPHQIAFNCLPHIDIFLESGYTKEEEKMIWETKKIMEEPDLKVTATTVRVPVFYGHSEAVNLELKGPLSPEDAKRLLAEAPGVKVYDDPASYHYPLAVDAAGTDEVWVGRIRQDKSVDHGLDLWIVADNIRKGAALNAVQIAELLARGKD